MEKIKPEIIAAITAAVQAMCGKDGKVVAVKIKRNETWSLASKINR